MKEQLEHRLNELKAEFESGHKMLADLEARQADLRNTLVRITGAIQVLEELLSEEQTKEQSPDEIPKPKLQKIASRQK